MPPPPDPRTTTSNALTRFLNDTRGLAARDARAVTRRQLLTLALRAEGNAKSHPCRSVRAIRRYRALLPKVAERRTQPRGRKPGPASVRGTLERDALAVDAGLKQLPGTRRCGGGATRAGTNLATRGPPQQPQDAEDARDPAGGALGGAQRRGQRLHRPEHGRRRLPGRQRRPGRAGLHAAVRGAARRAHVGAGVERARLHARRHRAVPQAGAGGGPGAAPRLPVGRDVRRQAVPDRPRRLSRTQRDPAAAGLRHGARRDARPQGRRGSGAGRAVRPAPAPRSHLHLDGRDRDLQEVRRLAAEAGAHGPGGAVPAPVPLVAGELRNGGPGACIVGGPPGAELRRGVPDRDLAGPAPGRGHARRQQDGGRLRGRDPRGGPQHRGRGRAHLHPRRAEQHHMHAPHLRPAARRHLARAELPRGLSGHRELPGHERPLLLPERHRNGRVRRRDARPHPRQHTRGRAEHRLEDRDLPDRAAGAARATTSTTTPP